MMTRAGVMAVAVVAGGAVLAAVAWRQRASARGPAALKRLVQLYRQRDEQPLRVQSIDQEDLAPDSSQLERIGLREGASWEAVGRSVDAIAQKEPSTRLVLLVRHGEGLHNVAERELGSERWENVEAKKEKYLDARLNDVGEEQCRLLAGSVRQALAQGLKIDAIIVSPLTRALDTAKLGLAPVWGKVPTYAVEMCRERFGKNLCDKRRSVSELKREYPTVNFDLFMEAEEDPWWTPRRETDEEILKRVAYFYNWLVELPPEWRNVAVVGHSSFMAQSVQALGSGFYWPANGELLPLVVQRKPKQ